MDVEDQRVAMLPVRIPEAEFAGLYALVLEHLQDRMDLADVEAAAGLHEPSHYACPAADVGQPAEHATRRVHDVELVAEPDRELVDVRFDEPRVGEADVGGELSGDTDRCGREVDTGDRGAEPRPGQRVQPEMALQVEQALPGDVAKGLDLIRADPEPAFAEPRDVIELALGMDRGPRVPESLIGRERRLELGSRRAVVGWFVTRR